MKLLMFEGCLLLLVAMVACGEETLHHLPSSASFTNPSYLFSPNKRSHTSNQNSERGHLVRHRGRTVRPPSVPQSTAAIQPHHQDKPIVASSTHMTLGATHSNESTVKSPPQKRESPLRDLAAVTDPRNLSTHRRGLFFNFYPPIPKHRPPPHRPPGPRPPAFHPPVRHPPPRHPPNPNHGPPPHKPDFPEFEFDFDPPNFFESSGFHFPDEEDSYGFGHLHDEVEEFFNGPHEHDDNDYHFSSPHPPLKPFDIFSPDFEEHPSLPPQRPPASPAVSPHINFITEDSIYRDDVPVKEVHNDRDKVHPGLDPGGVKALSPDFLFFIKEQTKAYVNNESSSEFE
ncbi:cyclin-K-like [Homarus americanus]|uniref:cyclin-K-like n=1 Tax=Homarus americanus TaxID=6706 RepID=UPI001C465EAE|nr:cyclin-K-like [Homarus americanus]